MLAHVPSGSKVGANGLELSLQKMSREKEDGVVRLYGEISISAYRPLTGHYETRTHR